MTAPTSLRVTPEYPLISLDLKQPSPTATQQFAAIAGFADGSTLDVTNRVTWSSSATQVASISGSGLATATSARPGWTFITAAFPHGIMGQTALSTTPFSPTGSLNIARYGHTATLLPSGKVLIAGGRNNSVNALSSVELFDPVTGTFTLAANMTSARYQHTATLLPGGAVLIAGGSNENGNGLSSAELYDPFYGTFTTVGNLTSARYQHTATLLNTGGVLIAGGSNETTTGLSSAQLYDPYFRVFTITGGLYTGRGRHTATLLNDGTVLVAGGVGGFGQLSGSERYYPSSPTSGFFHISGTMADARSNHTATLLGSGSVLITGGASGNSTSITAELYYPPSETFSATGNMTRAREGHTATLIPPDPSNYLLVIGGYFQTGSVLSSAETYSTGTFTRIGSEMPGSLYTARTGHTATLLPTGMLLIAGGMNESGAIASAEWAYTVMTYIR